MTTIRVQQTDHLSGTLQAPGSKSYTHRAMIAAALSSGWSELRYPLICDDTKATLEACHCFGAQIKKEKYAIWIHGSKLTVPNEPIDCRESGSTLRFLIPIAALCHGEIHLTGSPGLLARPVGPLIQALEQLGVKAASHKGYPPAVIHGQGHISGGTVNVVGNVSSQYITGLLLACPLADDPTEIIITTPLESKPYVELTLDVLQKHKITVDTSSDYRHFRIPSQQQYREYHHIVPGDFSSASFLMVAAAITRSKVSFSNLVKPQPDSAILQLLKRMNCHVQEDGTSIHIQGKALQGINIDAANVLDLVPACAVAACFAQGETVIMNAKRLRIKESDRLSTLNLVLSEMGASITESEDSLHITGGSQLHGTVVQHHNDHRIAMAAAIAGLKAEEDTVIPNAECVNKSYPTFFTDLQKLGAKIVVT
jgi:3-phosphoshikimate 1-carboxyvinyltransferase